MRKASGVLAETDEVGPGIDTLDYVSEECGLAVPQGKRIVEYAIL